MRPKYERIILKISGEALQGDESIFNHTMLERVADEIIDVVKQGIQIGVVVGGGNIWRGRSGAMAQMNKITADHMGMIATTINALAVQDALERKGQPTRVMTAVEMRSFAEPYIQRRAVRHLEKGRVIVFACGTGNPGFSTDTGAALRAFEMDAKALLLAKNVDGIYDCDPREHANAVRYERVSYDEVLEKNLKATDATAIAMCRENSIPIVLFALGKPGNILRVAMGEDVGTVVG